ncbi:hypothetical protein OGAPHI_006760 [Ogataea philodendri]|uniref:Vacuolar-sorting protein SNF8 n=1 Tax=Ogataea philodendri TaxID=1378263 RepID=A0A9P8T036_9ASCO|nr:uncharacterized protein OGAPHI_006760 [Ogataea philodendri]KAH3661353.1 hypothetical protein OGAPHI_006760 [Ogataea philodendri]
MSRKGLASFDNTEDQRSKFQNLGQAMLKQREEELKTQVQVFQNALVSFKEEHKNELMANSQLRTQFSQICESFGVDPLYMTAEDDLDPQERNNRLAIRIYEICQATRDLYGGIISVDEIIKIITGAIQDGWQFRMDHKDVETAVESLSVLGGELKLVKIGSKSYVKSILQEFSADQTQILTAADAIGYVTVSLLRDNFNWKSARCKSNLDDLISIGLLWLDTQGPEKAYWSTTWINKPA